MAASEGRQYDLIVFGSTGFTGKFVAEEVYRLQNEGGRALKWAAAGRNEAKVKACLEGSGIEGIDAIVADVSDQASLEAMCAKTSVLINCVGPYQLYGEPVVRACVSQKCNYVDITGETYFMERMVAEYGEQAKEAGVYIVPSCGFDCIPNELGTLLLQRAFNGDLAYVESYMCTHNSKGFNIGTWESFLRSIRTHKKLLQLRKEQKMQPLPLPDAKPPKRRMIFYSDVSHSWCVPFPTADRAAVYRSQRYRYDNEEASPYTFRTYFGLGSLFQAIGIAVVFLMILPLIFTNFGLKLLLMFPGFFSGGMASKNGPSKKVIEKATFTVSLAGAGYTASADRSKPPDARITVKVRGADPGYIATSAMLVQSALALLEEKDSLPQNGGIYTPSVAFGSTNIIEHLEDTGKVKFEVLQN